MPGNPPDLTLCDREPISRLERIQSFGFLIAMTKEWTIVRASANLESFFGVSAPAAMGMKLDDLVDPEALHDIRNRMTFVLSSKGVERLYGVPFLPNRPRLDIAVHYVNSLIILEGEPSNLEDHGDTASLVRAMVYRLSTQVTLDAFHRDAARQVRVMTGFDRVMIYRFDHSGAGEVIAEALANGLEPYLGLHYPASDIPVQARALYLRNTFRVIADAHAPTVPLLPDSPGTETLDQSMAFTRAVSPVHIEYLRNMGVTASLSISIVVEGALWGLIVCHHRTPRLPSFVIRTAAELFGQMYSMKLERRLRRFDLQVERKVQDLLDRLRDPVAADETVLRDAAWWRKAIGTLIECDGIAVIRQSAVSLEGATPPLPDIEAIAQRVDAIPGTRIFTTDHLAALRPEAALHADVAAGVLVIPLTRRPQNYILLFRRELAQSITWAGNPEKAVVETDEGLRLSPRKSFAAFSTINRGRSQPFTEQNRRAAQLLRSGLIEAIVSFSSDADEERLKFAQRQELLIAELNHRVRNIIGLIRGLINQPGTASGDVATYVQSLNGRVQALARAHDQITRLNWGPGRLASLVDQEVDVYLADKRKRFTVEGPDIFLHPQAFSTFSLVIHELVTNSVKYGSLSDGGNVSLTLIWQVGEGLYMKWRETDGPPVKAPTRRGFGSVIIERVVPFDLKGKAQVRYEPAGFEADFFIPEEHIATNTGILSMQQDEPPSMGSVPEELRPLQGMTVLLLEDNLILALETEDLLHRLGAHAVFLAGSIAAATTLLESERFDFAVLDVHVGNHTSQEFALSVRDAKIPYVFATGYGENISLGPEHAAACVVSKPYGRLELSLVIGQALGRQARGRGLHQPDLMALQSRQPPTES